MRKILAILLGSSVLLFFGIDFVLAAGGVCDPCNTSADCNTGLQCINGVCQDPSNIVVCNPTHYKNILDVIAAIANLIFWIAVAIVPLMIIIGSIMFLTAGGDSMKVTKAKSLLFWAMVGLGVLLLSKAIAALIEGILK